MKKIAYYSCILLILFLLASCVEKKPLQESNTDSVETADVIVTSEMSNPTETADVIATPEMTNSVVILDNAGAAEYTSTPTLNDFNIDEVEMLATQGSSCFSGIGYDSDWEVLVVQFRNSGSVYTYSDFPISEWNKFISADSLGRWYNKHIKNQYKCDALN